MQNQFDVRHEFVTRKLAETEARRQAFGFQPLAAAGAPMPQVPPATGTKAAAALTQDSRLSAFEAGKRFESDDAVESEVLAVSGWAPGWTRIALCLVA